MRLLVALLGVALMLVGLAIEALFIFQHLVSGVGLIDKIKDTTLMLCGPLVFSFGLSAVSFGLIGQGFWSFVLSGIALFVGVSWTVFNFSYVK